MDLKDVLYDKRDEFGIKDITIDELSRIINFIKIWDNPKEDEKILNNDIVKLVDISMKMKNLLEECRLNKLPIKLSKKIDDILEEIEYL